MKATFIDRALKRSPAVSNTRALADRSIAIMRHAAVEVDVIRSIDHDVLLSPIWLGEKSALCNQVALWGRLLPVRLREPRPSRLNLNIVDRR